MTRDKVDFARSLILVDRSYDGPTKSKHVRHVPLAPELRDILRDWFKRNEGPYVVTVEGHPITLEFDIARGTHRACKRAGIAQVNFHQLRHTFVSHLAMRVPLPVAGALAGHAAWQMTQRYAHLSPESLACDPRVPLSFAANGERRPSACSQASTPPQARPVTCDFAVTTI